MVREFLNRGVAYQEVGNLRLIPSWDRGSVESFLGLNSLTVPTTKVRFQFHNCLVVTEMLAPHPFLLSFTQEGPLFFYRTTPLKTITYIAKQNFKTERFLSSGWVRSRGPCSSKFHANYIFWNSNGELSSIMVSHVNKTLTASGIDNTYFNPNIDIKPTHITPILLKPHQVPTLSMFAVALGTRQLVMEGKADVVHFNSQLFWQFNQTTGLWTGQPQLRGNQPVSACSFNRFFGTPTSNLSLRERCAHVLSTLPGLTNQQHESIYDLWQGGARDINSSLAQMQAELWQVLNAPTGDV